MACRDLAFGELEGLAIRVLPAGAGNAVKDSWGRFSLHVAVRSANERIFAERKTTYLPAL